MIRPGIGVAKKFAGDVGTPPATCHCVRSEFALFSIGISVICKNSIDDLCCIDTVGINHNFTQVKILDREMVAVHLQRATR